MKPFVRPDFWLFADTHLVNGMSAGLSQCKSVMMWMKKRVARNKRLFAVGLITLLPLTAFGAAGDLDTTFNSGGIKPGIVTTTVAGITTGVPDLAIQADGKIVAVASAKSDTGSEGLAIARYNPDGNLDTSFNGTGMIITLGDYCYGYKYTVALQPDGKIVIGGNSSKKTNSDFMLVRYNFDGSLDTTFNGTGKVITPIGTGNDFGADVALQPDGKIVLVGSTYYGGIYYGEDGGSEQFLNLVVVRYNSDGSLDTTFNDTGKAIMFDGDNIAEAVALQPDGKIVVAGTNADDLTSNFIVARYNSNGSLDSTFNTTGKVITPNTGWTYAMALQSDGKVVVTGDGVMARYNSNGSLDATFDGDGIVNISLLTSENMFTASDYALVVQPDGKIVAAGLNAFKVKTALLTSFSREVSLRRYNSDGGLDVTFNKASTSIPANDGYDGYVSARTIALQADGKIVVAVDSHKADRGFTIVRYLGTTEITSYTAFGTLLGKTGKPLAGATIHLGEYTATTDKNGNWSISDLLAGDYPVVASKGDNADECGIARILDNGQYQQQVDSCTVTYGDNNASVIAIWQSVNGNLQYVDKVTVEAFDAKFQEGRDYKIVDGAGEYVLEGIDDAGNTTSKVNVVRIQ